MTLYNSATKRSVFEDGPSLGSLWSIEKLAMDLAGGGFLNLEIGTVAPIDTTKVWLNQGSGVQASEGVISVHDGTSWISNDPVEFAKYLVSLSGFSGGPTVTASNSSTSPSSPTLGDQWYAIDTGKQYLRTNDGTADIWLQINASGAAAISFGDGSVI